MRYVFVHGWGFDHRFWQPLLDELQPDDPLCLDFGYFGGEIQLDLPDEPYIAVGHSAGSLWLLDHVTDHCAGIIALNGFARFAQSEDFPDGVPGKVLTRMRRQIGKAPLGVLADFRARIHATEGWTGEPNVERLAEGLDRLLTDDRREDARRRSARLAWLAGADDPLLSPVVARASFPEESFGAVVPGGHLLPIERPCSTAAFIRECVERIS